MTNFIPTYLINTSEDFEKWVRKQPFYYKAGIIFLNSSEQFFKVLNDNSKGFCFRLLFHPGLTGSSTIEEKDLLDVEAIHNTFRSNADFTDINIPLITRANFLKRLKELDNNAIHFNHLGYRFYYAPYCSTDEFINDIPIFQKGINSHNSEPLATSEHPTIIKPKITVITALTDDEYSSFRDNINISEELNGIVKGQFTKYDKFKFDYPESINFIRQKNRMGSVESALTTIKAFSTDSDITIMSGVCGGRKSKDVNLYDIIIADQSLDIITGKFKTDKFITYGYQAKTNEDLIEFLSESNRKEEIKDRMYSLVPNTDKVKNKIVNELEIRFGPIACGPFVLKSENFLDQKSKEINDKILGFEMESYGVLRATEHYGQNDKLSLVVKSVMDFTDENKSDILNGENIKSNAAYMSYLCVRVLIPYIDEFYKKKF